MTNKMPAGSHPAGGHPAGGHPAGGHPAGGNFDGVTPLYDALAWLVFGNRLRQAQLVFLNRIPAGASVLIVGGGTGWILEQVLRSVQPSRVVYLEPSARMLARASQRMIRKANIGTVEFRLGDEQCLHSDERFDVIITPFVLDLFTESTLRNAVIPRLRAVLRPDGYWLVTDFIKSTRWWQQVLLWLMIRFFRLTAQIESHDLVDWGAGLDRAGLSICEREIRVGGMVVAELRRFADDPTNRL